MYIEFVSTHTVLTKTSYVDVNYSHEENIVKTSFTHHSDGTKATHSR